MTPPLDPYLVRRRFPALSRTENGLPAAYLDGPGGTQVPNSVIDAMSKVLREGVSNLGGGFGASDDASGSPTMLAPPWGGSSTAHPTRSPSGRT